MAIEVVSIGSSSSGNSYLIMAGKHNIILDVGLAAKRIIAALEKFNITPEEVDAVLVTHEHVDHVRSVRAIGRKCKNAVFITSRGTAENTENFKYIPAERLMLASSGDRIQVTEEASQECEEGDASGIIYCKRLKNANRNRSSEDHTECPEINADDTEKRFDKYSEKYNNVTISAFAISHDAAEPLSYTIEYAGEKLAVVTDTGIVTDSIYEAIRDADILVFESNHDEELLMFGEYPYPLKMRIKGDYGHLSNRYAGGILSKLLSDRASHRLVNPAANPTKTACLTDKLYLSNHWVKSNNQHPSASKEAEAVGMTEATRASECVKEAAGEYKGVSQAADSKPPLHIMLAHLSFHNNAPFYARTTIEEILQKSGFVRGRDYTLTIAARDELTLFD